MPTVPKAKRPPWMPKRDAHGRRVRPNQHIYNASWYRKAVLAHKKANPNCVECLKEGVVTPVRYTDHIQPINQGGAVMDTSNWQSLCKYHHDVKSGGEAHQAKKYQ